MSRKNVLLLFILLALVLRIAYTAFLQRNYFFLDHPSADVTYYQDWADRIRHGGWVGTETFFGLPLYPYFLAVIKGLTLNHPFLIRLVHLALGTLNCLLVYLIAEKIFSVTVARVSVLLAATNFILIYYDWLMMPVTLIITLSLFIVFILLHRERLQTRRDWFLLGILIGLAALGDGKFLLIFAGLLFWSRRSPRFLLALSLGVLVCVFGVTLRNRIVGGDWVLISAQSGLSFYAGNNPEATGVYENPRFIRANHLGQDKDQKIVAQAAMARVLSPGEVSAFWKSKAFQFIREQPTQYLGLLTKKFVLFFRDAESAHDLDLLLQKTWRGRLDWNPFFILCPLALAGMVLSRKTEGVVYPNLLILSQLILTLIFFLTTRHRATILPFLLIYEAYFLCWAWEQIKGRQFRPLAVACAAVIGMMVLLPPKPIEAKTMAFIRAAKAGPVYEEHGLLNEAELAYRKALQLKPQDTLSLYNLGNVYFKQENWPEAERLYLASLESCAYNNDALFNLGVTYEKTGRLDQAVATYESILRYEPEAMDVHYRLADLHQRRGTCSESRHHIDTLLRLQPSLAPEVSRHFAGCLEHN